MAEFSMARRSVYGVHCMPLASMPLSSSATQPHALGDDIDVPFMSWRDCSDDVGTGPMAPPAHRRTHAITQPHAHRGRHFDGVIAWYV
jgi:hypothetical protein